MTRKEYRILADALAEAYIAETAALQGRPRDCLTWAHHGMGVAVRYIVEALERDNPRFDAAMFTAATRGLKVPKALQKSHNPPPAV